MAKIRNVRHADEMPDKLHCPACLQEAVCEELKPNEEWLSVAQFYECSTEYYDGYVARFKCENGHIFYIAIEVNK